MFGPHATVECGCISGNAASGTCNSGNSFVYAVANPRFGAPSRRASPDQQHQVPSDSHYPEFVHASCSVSDRSASFFGTSPSAAAQRTVCESRQKCQQIQAYHGELMVKSALPFPSRPSDLSPTLAFTSRPFPLPSGWRDSTKYESHIARPEVRLVMEYRSHGVNIADGGENSSQTPQQHKALGAVCPVHENLCPQFL